MASWLKKTIRWLGFTVILAFIPILWTTFWSQMHKISFSWSDVAVKGEFFLLTLAICGDAIGEIVGSNGKFQTIKNILGSILISFFLFSAFGYWDMIMSEKQKMTIEPLVALKYSLTFLCGAIISGAFAIALSED